MAKQWRITDRDIEILVFLTRYGASVAEQVRREFFGASPKAAYRRLKALEERGVVSGERIFYRMPAVYRVTEPGARLAEVDLPPPKNDLSRMHHTLELVELSWAIRHGLMLPDGSHPDVGPFSTGDGSTGGDGNTGEPSGEPWLGEGVDEWVTERELRRDKLVARREKETGKMLTKGKMGRIPDGLMLLESGKEVAVELELSPKRAANYHRIFSDYEQEIGSGELDGVRFYFSSRKAMSRVQELSRRHDLDGCLEFAYYEPIFERRR